MSEKEINPIPLILSIFVAITIKSTYDHVLENIHAYPNAQTILENILADPQRFALLTSQTIIFTFTLFRFYWGAYRYGQEVGKPTSLTQLIFDSAGIFVLFSGFYLTSMVVANTTLFYWAVALFHVVDFFLFLFVGLRGSINPGLRDAIQRWVIFDLVTSLPIVILLLLQLPGFWSQWLALAILSAVGVWDLKALGPFYTKAPASTGP